MMRTGRQRACALRTDSLMRVLWLLFGIPIILMVVTLPASAQEQKAARTYTFNIPAKPLPQAIRHDRRPGVVHRRAAIRKIFTTCGGFLHH